MHHSLLSSCHCTRNYIDNAAAQIAQGANDKRLPYCCTVKFGIHQANPAAFLDWSCQRHSGALEVTWNNAPAHLGPAMQSYLETPGLKVRLVSLLGYSPDFNADEAVWGWVREEATGNLCLGSREAVQERVGHFLTGLTSRRDEVRRRCRTVLQSRTETLPRDSRPDPYHPANAHPTFALV